MVGQRTPQITFETGEWNNQQKRQALCKELAKLFVQDLDVETNEINQEKREGEKYSLEDTWEDLLDSDQIFWEDDIQTEVEDLIISKGFPPIKKPKK